MPPENSLLFFVECFDNWTYTIHEHVVDLEEMSTQRMMIEYKGKGQEGVRKHRHLLSPEVDLAFEVLAREVLNHSVELEVLGGSQVIP